VVIGEFRTSFFPFVGGQIKEFLQDLQGRVSPELVLTHARCDLHQDHRVACELAWNLFRHHLILEYEIPKYDGDLGAPSFYMPVDSKDCQTKVEHLLECFSSQRNKSWFTREAYLGLMRLRGIECNARTGYAEAFYCRKASLAVTPQS